MGYTCNLQQVLEKILKVKFDIPKIDQNRTVTNLLSAAMFFQYSRCSQVKRLGKRPVLWEDSFDQGIRLPAGVFRWQDDNRAVVHERKHADVDVNCGGFSIGSS